ncbi:MAG: DUF1800 domain-containing protein [Acidimicrobiales bacterium]
MAIVTWNAKTVGEVVPIPTDENPGLTRLSAAGSVYRTFDSSADLPVGPVSGSIRTRSYFALYIETQTNRGRRQFKFTPVNSPVRLRFGYRYVVGLGRAVRNGTLQPLAVDLTALANQAEPGIVIGSITSVFARVRDDIEIEILDPTITPPPPPPPPPPNGEVTSSGAARLLMQATFGPTTTSIEELVSLGNYATWIDRQIAAPMSRTLPYVKANSNGSLRTTRHYIWFDNALNGDDQLRQRVAFAWSELFVVSDRDYVLGNSQYSVSQYYDLLAEQGLGNFRTLLETVTLHPAMGVFVSMLANERADPARNVRPDENFAREVLQLFSIGLYELQPDGQVRTEGGQPIPAYDQTTVEEFAKVFTGWNYDGQRTWYETNAGHQDRESPMVPYEEYHDTSEKRLLNGVVLPANQSARADMTAALDNIFNHPNVGPFIATHLIQRLVTSNPSPQYVGRVAAVFNNDGSGVRGNLAAVVKALLLDTEARTGHEAEPETFGKLREPVLRLTQVFRAFEAQPGPIANGVYMPEGGSIDGIDEIVGQSVMRSRSVFNFFRPDNPLEPGSDLVSPELQILSEINVASTNNMFFNQIYSFNNRSDGYGAVSRLQVEREVAMAGDATALVDHLDLLLTADSMPAAARAAIVDHIESVPNTDEGRFTRALDAMFLVTGSPFHLVQK